MVSFGGVFVWLFLLGVVLPWSCDCGGLLGEDLCLLLGGVSALVEGL